MPYTPNTTWVDGSGGGTPLSAARLNNLELGLPLELAYNQITGNVTVTATTAPTANTVVTASAVTFNGSTIALVEFFAPCALEGSTYVRFVLYDGSTELGVLGQNNIDVPVRLAARLTPSAASHTYSVRAYVDAGTGTIVANTGAAGAFYPAFIRITRVS